MTSIATQGPDRLGGVYAWRDAGHGAEVRFAGKAAVPRDIPALVQRIGPPDGEAVWLRQVHGATAVAARPGRVEEGDALFTHTPGQVLAVVTADCVPVLLAAPDAVAAVHAGWRGIVAGVVPATIERLATPAEAMTAWIGPAIGACCYEVGDEVAAQVIGASGARGASIARPGPRGRPHLDLRAAVARQLARAGVTAIRTIDVCTRCDEARLWSYRRDGRRAGRNVALIWLTG